MLAVQQHEHLVHEVATDDECAHLQWGRMLLFWYHDGVQDDSNSSAMSLTLPAVRFSSIFSLVCFVSELGEKTRTSNREASNHMMNMIQQCDWFLSHNIAKITQVCMFHGYK